MKNVVRLLGVLIPFLFCVSLLGAEPQAGRARIALFEPSAPRADAALKAILATVADTVELSLTCLDCYDIKRLPAVDPTADLKKIRAYCATNKIDQAIGGNASARKGGGYAFKLIVYDRKSDSISVVSEGASQGALDLFDVTDTLVASLLDGLSGTHLLFGSLSVDTDPPGARVSVNGRDVGAAPVALRGLPVGTLRITARSDGYEEGEDSVAINDGEAASASLDLVRSMGMWAAPIPEDATVTFRSSEIGEQVIDGTEAEVQLPTGSYDVEATCPNLAPVSTRLTVKRGETSRWLPWPRAYLVVESDPPKTKIFVDDKERGASPAVLEVEPGVLHKVELRREKYDVYRSDINVSLGNKKGLSATLTPHPGSLRVETNMSGATVWVDGVDSKDTPCTFEGLAPGSHEVSISPVLWAKRFYVCEEKYVVDVASDEVATLSKTLVPGKGQVQILDAPPGSTISIDGTPVDPALVATTGVEIPAGVFDIVVTSPAQQKWRNAVTLSDGLHGRWSLESFTSSLPRRTVKVDGKSNDWTGLWPQWSKPARTDLFPNQPGTQPTKIFMCRDDKYLYGRMDFADGTPTMKLSGDIADRLVYNVQIPLRNGDLLIMEVASSRRHSTWRWNGIWHPASKTGTTLQQDFSYRAADSMLEFAVPVDTMTKYLGDGPFNTEVYVANADENGQWLNNSSSGRCRIDFVK
jgi:hypothetical protein